VKKIIVLSGFLVLLCGVSGCGSSADSLIKEEIKGMDDLADALENNAPQSKIDEISKRLKETDKKLEDLKLSDEEKKKVIEQNKAELERVTKRLAAAMLKAGKDKLGDLGKLTGMPDLGKPPGLPQGADQLPGIPAGPGPAKPK
jgi:chromosome segregation ATPase